jgi:hypothetical protein
VIAREATRAGIFAVLTALLVWQVISRSLVAYLAERAPEAALTLSATYPRALLNLAEMHLGDDAPREVGAAADTAMTGQAQTTQPADDRLRALTQLLAKSAELSRPAASKQTASPTDPSRAVPVAGDQVRAWAELALADDPLNSRALRILGQLADRSGEEARATSYMQAAAQASIRESVAVFWLMQKSFEKHDYDAALAYADALLRTRSQVLPHVLPTLARIAENPAAKDGLKRLLSNNPPWRGQFFSALPRAVTDARTPLELLLAVRETSTPPTAADMREYFNVLIENKLYELAYYTWLQFLAPEQLSSTGLLFNGDFEHPPSGLPFDWRLPPGTGVTVDIVQRDDRPGQKALLIEMGPGRVEFPGVAQMLLLAPGSYQLNGQYKGEVVGRRGLIWRVTCAGGTGAPIGQSPMIVGTFPAWQTLEFTFSVPEVDCRAQHLRLELDARSASEQLVAGSIWWDELQIQRSN